MTTPTPTTPMVMSIDERRVLAAYRRLKAESAKTRRPRRMVVSMEPMAPVKIERCQLMG